MGAGGILQLQGDQQPFPQPRPLGDVLLERQLVLLGSLLAVVSEANQVQILDVMTSAAKGAALGKAKGKEHPNTRQAVITCVCCAALAGLDSLARRYRGMGMLRC